VRNYDEDLPANTIRAWAIGLILATLGSGINSLLSLRQPTIVITSFAIQLIAYPLGRVWDRIMPDKQYEIYGAKFNLKPGRFNYKEHTVIVVMANSSFGGGAIYSTDVLVTQMVFYGQNFGYASKTDV
jgi:predicted outer membrane repeat protein